MCAGPYDVACVEIASWRVCAGRVGSAAGDTQMWLTLSEEGKKMNELEKERKTREVAGGRGMLNSVSAFCSAGGACCVPRGWGELLAFGFCQW